MCLEISRVLKPQGYYLCMSYAPQYLREKYLKKDELKRRWKLEVKKIELEREEQTKCLSVLEDDNGAFFLYAMRKTSKDADEEDEEGSEEEQVVAFCENPIFIRPKKTTSFC